MRVAITSTGPTLDSPVDPRFGRCAYFIIVDTDTMEFQAIPNPAVNATGGAGTMAAQLVASQGVQAVVTGEVGPNALAALQAAGIGMITGVTGTVRDAIEMIKSGNFSMSTPQVPPTAPPGPGFEGPGGGGGWGRGRGGGWGRGRGGGGGWGRGGGRGRGSGWGRGGGGAWGAGF